MIELCRKYFSVWCISLCVIICIVIYAFQSESTLFSYLNFKELIAWKSYDIWSLSDNMIWTQNQLVCKQILYHLARLTNDWDVLWVLICMVTKQLSICLWTKWLWV